MEKEAQEIEIKRRNYLEKIKNQPRDPITHGIKRNDFTIGEIELANR